MPKVKEFCSKANKKGITFNALINCINALQSGRRMSSSELQACDFLAEPDTFWNPGKALDYNWFLQHKDEIRRELAEAV